jgi:hypothetical protein
MNSIHPLNPISAVSSASQFAAGGTSHSTTSTDSGATPGDSVDLSLAAVRELIQAGRIAMQTSNGNLSGSQVSGLESQEQAVSGEIAADKQSNGGELTAAEKTSINQTQTQISHEIYSEAHGLSVTTPTIPVTPPTVAGS